MRISLALPGQVISRPSKCSRSLKLKAQSLELRKIVPMCRCLNGQKSFFWFLVRATCRDSSICILVWRPFKRKVALSVACIAKSGARLAETQLSLALTFFFLSFSSLLLLLLVLVLPDGTCFSRSTINKVGRIRWTRDNESESCTCLAGQVEYKFERAGLNLIANRSRLRRRQHLTPHPDLLSIARTQLPPPSSLSASFVCLSKTAKTKLANFYASNNFYFELARKLEASLWLVLSRPVQLRPARHCFVQLSPNWQLSL